MGTRMDQYIHSCPIMD